MSNSGIGEESPTQSSSERPTTASHTSSAMKPSSLQTAVSPTEVAQVPMAPIIGTPLMLNGELCALSMRTLRVLYEF